ncbi:hypothetical protein [Dactylosporangium sp. CA-233914]|uniref:hypothetical protein n=1 Tax=Dactylosporangium sp. CA-233914 TaxID=3239934 RepID=UPI003D8C1671
MHKSRKVMAAAVTFTLAGIGVAIAAGPASAASCNTTDVIAIETVQAYFRQIESARNGRHDGLIGLTDLIAVANSSNFSPAVRHSASIVAQPRLFNQLDTAARGGRRDGLLSAADLRAGCR